MTGRDALDGIAFVNEFCQKMELKLLTPRGFEIARLKLPLTKWFGRGNAGNSQFVIFLNVGFVRVACCERLG